MSARYAAALALAGLIAGGACILPATAQEGVVTGCAVTASVPWQPAGGRLYRVSAVASGRDCASANVVLMVRGAAGPPLLSFTSAAADLPLLFAEARTEPAMMAALHRWIGQPAGRTTRNLPAWDAGEEMPHAGDLAFQPEPAIMRAHYADLRKWGWPVFTFVQGRESEAWYALDVDANRLTLIGTQMLAG